MLVDCKMSKSSKNTVGGIPLPFIHASVRDHKIVHSYMTVRLWGYILECTVEEAYPEHAEITLIREGRGRKAYCSHSDQ